MDLTHSLFFTVPITLIILCWVNSSESETVSTAEESGNYTNSGETYQKLLAEKRYQQITAVKTLISLKDVKQQQKLIKELLANIKKVLVECKAYVGSGDLRTVDEMKAVFGTAASSMKENMRLKETISRTVENTAFVSQLALYFPDLARKIFHRDEEFLEAYRWALDLSRGLQLHDSNTDELLNLAGEELNILPRRENYANPYSLAAQRETLERAAVEEMLKRQAEVKASSRKSKKIPRIPSLSRPTTIEL